MQLKKRIFAALAVTTLCAAGAAHAGPAVTVTVKNLGTAEAKYSMVGNVEALTNAGATPKPADVIRPKEASTFVVRGALSPDMTTAVLRYKIGAKTCVFKTAFVNTIVPGGLGSGTIKKAPKWTKDAESTGGARCNASISATSLSDFSWKAEFTIQ
ncbi:hypothetical protein [Pseudomonas muyukensis]|uniref:DUF4402 domain-containing protein n=1 Tax=Pseudomonas muyukensis TaxID=2842357 RepID=A0ABX8M9E8_9PSED|nr:hypothetical protein [Pseudomonas muyukensis]QXH35707.1 hypothetical protein KSS95_02455 [Pseudomonas muyukensis]